MPSFEPLLLVNLLAYCVIGLAVFSWWHVGKRWSNKRAALRRRRRRRVPWDLDGGLLAAVFLAGAWSAMLSAPADAEPPRVSLAGAALFAATWIGLTVISIAILQTRRGARLADYGAPDSLVEIPGDIVIGVAGCALMMLPVYAVQIAIVWGMGQPSSHPTVLQLINDPSGETLLAAALMAVLIAPVFEELAFRVLLQGGLERLAERQAIWPIVVSSVAFALAHTGQGWAPVPLFVFALGLGYVYRQTHRYLPILVMHMTFNALGLVMALSAAHSQSSELPATNFGQASSLAQQVSPDSSAVDFCNSEAD